MIGTHSYPVDETMVPGVDNHPDTCPECGKKWGTGRIILADGSMQPCICLEQHLAHRYLKQLAPLPKLKPHTNSRIAALIQEAGTFLVSAPQRPIGKLTIFDIHLRRALVGIYSEHRRSHRPLPSWNELTLNTVLDICWDKSEGKRNAMAEELKKPAILVIKSMTWKLPDSGFDTLAEIIHERNSQDKVTFLVGPELNPTTEFKGSFGELYKMLVTDGRGIHLSWNMRPTQGA